MNNEKPVLFYVIASSKHRSLSRKSFFRHYEPDTTDILNTKRDNGMWIYWKSKRSGKRVRVTE